MFSEIQYRDADATCLPRLIEIVSARMARHSEQGGSISAQSGP